ncbi:response regulator transcription factor [Brucella sp. TWI432]
MTLSAPDKQSLQIILVEDDLDLSQSLADYLRLRQMIVTEVASGLEFYKALNKGTFDVAVVDANLPDTSGFDIVGELSSLNTIGIIMLTARTAREDRIDGYSRGADLYMTKPVDGEELGLAINNLAKRTRTKLREQKSDEEDILRFSIYERALYNSKNQKVILSGREALMFEYLISNSGRTVRRDEISNLFSDGEMNPDSRSLDAALARLRSKFKKSGIQFPIQIAHGLGIRINKTIIY